MKKIITDNELGTIILSKNNRAKRLVMRLKTDHIAVTLPTYTSYDDAMNFVKQKRDWILTNHKKNSRKLISNDNPFRSFTFEVKLSSAVRKNYLISLLNGVLTIEYPEHISPDSEQAQQVFRTAIENVLRHEAKRVLPDMLSQLARQHGFTFADVKISSAKTRWGTCSSRGNINLSYYLMTLPGHLITYVLLHELCHTHEMNHGPRFWALLDSVTGSNARKWAGEIKKYSTTAAF